MSVQVQSHDPVADKAVNEPASPAVAASATTPAPTDAKASELAETPAASGAAKTEEVETEGKTDTEKDPETDAGGDVGKKKGGFQKKIDKLTAKAADKDREIEYWRAEALKNASKPNTDTTPKPQSKESADKPKADNFETHADFVEALTDWKTDQKLKERDSKLEQSRAETESQKVGREYAERAKSFSAKTPDFMDVLEEVDDVPLSPAVRDLFLTSENGPELAYELAKSRDEFTRVNKLSPLAAAREIGKLEARLAKPSSETKESKTTKAPTPINPVRATGGANVSRSLEDIAVNGTQAEYEQARAKQRAAKG
ncbi:MAG: hypothetical protein V4568_14640 [Pseudomonadota bacterium]